MSLESTLLWILVAGALVAIGKFVVHGTWWTLGLWRVRQAGPTPIVARNHVLWRSMDAAAELDLTHGPGGPDGQPVPPFRFLEEHHGGSQPCLSLVDGRQRRWRAKWGNEVHSETFAVRFVWACGYFAEATYFVLEGTIAAARDLDRAAACLDADGRFTNARFELDDPAVKKHFEEHSWAWNDNPFVGSRELQGLKIVTMLLSNWDTKDRRDVARGSNTAIFEQATPQGHEARYLITDWGGSMGTWGSNIVTRGRWNADAFAGQTPQFVSAVEDGLVKFGYSGQRTEDVATGITPEDVRWLCRHLRRITDAHLDAALRASGAADDEREKFRIALRERIEQLERIAASESGRSVASEQK